MVALFFRIGENATLMAASAGGAGPTSEGSRSGLAGPLGPDRPRLRSATIRRPRAIAPESAPIGEIACSSSSQVSEFSTPRHPGSAGQLTSGDGIVAEGRNLVLVLRTQDQPCANWLAVFERIETWCNASRRYSSIQILSLIDYPHPAAA
jgi:hypothetical protein